MLNKYEMKERERVCVCVCCDLGKFDQVENLHQNSCL